MRIIHSYPLEDMKPILRLAGDDFTVSSCRGTRGSGTASRRNRLMTPRRARYNPNLSAPEPCELSARRASVHMSLPAPRTWCCALYFRAGYKRQRPHGLEKKPPRDLGGFFVFYASSRKGLRFLPNSAGVSDSQKQITGPPIRRDFRRASGRSYPEVSDRRRDFAARVIAPLSLLQSG